MRIVLMVAALMATGSCERVTQGDLRDMEAADEVTRCARNYIRMGSSDPEHTLWSMCLDAVTEMNRRDRESVAARVVRAEGDVFSE